MSETYNDRKFNWKDPFPHVTPTNSEIALASGAFQHKQPIDPTTAALDALRQAVVAQTALLRSLSEQVRLGQAATNGALDGLASTIGHFYGDTGEALAGLAERLEKLEAHFTSGPSWTQGFTTAAKQYNEELTGHLQAIEAKLGEIDSRTVNQWTAIELTQREMRTALARKKITRKDLQAAARRKAKR